MPPAISRARSRLALSSGGTCSEAGPDSSRGSATFLSSPVAKSKAQRQLAGSAPPWERRKTTREPSGATVKLLGAPKLKRRVRAYWRGNPPASPWPAARWELMENLPGRAAGEGGAGEGRPSKAQDLLCPKVFHPAPT